MNALQRAGHSLARVPGGKVGKWVVLGVWLVLLLGLGSLAGKLTGAEDNQASSWLPGSAESTQVLMLQRQFGTADTARAVVLYTRPTGITPADKAKATADATAFARAPHVVGTVQGPVPSTDGKALQT